MAFFFDVKIRLKTTDSRLQSQVLTADGDSGWLPVSDDLPRLAEALAHLSEEQLNTDLNVYRARQMEMFFGNSSDPRRKLLRRAIGKLSVDQNELRIILEPLDDNSRLKAYNLPAEAWSFSSDQPTGYHEPDNPLPSIVRLVPQNRLASQSVPDEWRVAWMGGHRSIDTLLKVRDYFRGPGIKFAGAFPLLHLKDLREALEESNANIVWLVGAGDQKSASFFLKDDQKIEIAELCSAFRGIQSLQLLFVHSCHIGNLSIGLATRLIQETGIPMVVTWETRNGDSEGLLQKDILPPFAKQFFSNFADHKPAEMSLAIARNHLFRHVYGKGILNCKACPLAFKATHAAEIQIKPTPPRLPQNVLLRHLAEAYQFEESSQLNKAGEIYRTLTNCKDKDISRIANIRLRLISFNSAGASPDSAS